MGKDDDARSRRGTLPPPGIMPIGRRHWAQAESSHRFVAMVATAIAPATFAFAAVVPPIEPR
jgi:hypothetical protein